MQTEGPELAALLHRLAECPPEFLEVEAAGDAEGIDVAAIVCDHMRRVSPGEVPEQQSKLLSQIGRGPVERLAAIAIACWLLHDEWFFARPELAPAMWRLLVSKELAQLTRHVRPERIVADADRREEFTRLCLQGLGLRPRGDSIEQALDRLTTLDSAERARVLRATAAAERRAREVREAMVRQRALESASRYGE
jgi:hypothetical protein